MSVHRRHRALAVACASVMALAGCTGAVDGHGTDTSAGPSSGGTRSVEAGRVVTVTGASTGHRYRVTVWDSDTIADCSAHAYGARMIAFLRAHPCRSAHRVLATTTLNGRTVAISLIATSFPGTAANPYGVSAQFERLEQADGTGSLDDLLRDGGRIPGVTGQIPADEAFEVLGQDTGVSVFDAWYVPGPTTDQDPGLIRLEQDLFLSSLADN